MPGLSLVAAPDAQLGSCRLKNSHHTTDVLFVALILLTLGIVAVPNITEGGLGWSDAPNHTFDGIFILELIKQRPWGHLREWAEQFYLHYPALGIVVYYPPGFAIVEAVMFAILGVNILATRLTVLLFAVGASLLLYALGKRWFDRWTGLFAALLLITCPHGGLWMRDVMLEWPATFWMLAAVHAYERDRASGGQWRWAVALCCCLVMAYMTKQTAGFILPVLMLHALITGGVRRSAYLLQTRFLTSVLIAAGMIGGYHLWAQQYAALPGELLRLDFEIGQMVSWPAEILGWPLLGIALLGLIGLVLSIRRSASIVLVVWFLVWTGFSVCIAAKEPRYLFFSVAPLCLAAPRFMMKSGRAISWGVDRGRVVLLVLLTAIQLWLSGTKSVGPLPSYAPAVTELVARGDADLVLVDAVRDGQFVFDIYQNPEAKKRLVPLRASKALYARAAREKYSYQQFVQSRADIVELLENYGIRYIVIESQLPNTQYVDADPPPRKMLREFLRDDQRFKLIGQWPLRCDDPAWDDVQLCLYAYPDCPPRNSKTIQMSFPAMKKQIELQLP